MHTYLAQYNVAEAHSVSALFYSLPCRIMIYLYHYVHPFICGKALIIFRLFENYF